LDGRLRPSPHCFRQRPRPRRRRRRRSRARPEHRDRLGEPERGQHRLDRRDPDDDGERPAGHPARDAPRSASSPSGRSSQLTVDNLFDKRYYSAIADTGCGNFIGHGRSATLTLRRLF
jgi:hypothetical protein